MRRARGTLFGRVAPDLNPFVHHEQTDRSACDQVDDSVARQHYGYPRHERADVDQYIRTSVDPSRAQVRLLRVPVRREHPRDGAIDRQRERRKTHDQGTHRLVGRDPASPIMPSPRAINIAPLQRAAICWWRMERPTAQKATA